MALTTQTFAQFQAMFATQYSSVAAIPANTNPGSTLGAIANADALLALNVQTELIYVDNISRLATSYGADVDTFCNPFSPTGQFRILSSPSSGAVTVSTPSVATAQIVVPVGGVVATANGLLFTITSDPSNSTGDYSAALNGYTIGIGSSSANVLVTCNTPGSIGNVQAGTINQVSGTSTSPPLSGISSVSNAAAFTNGIDQESDAAVKIRFATYVSTGSVGTNNAIAAAVLGTQAGLTYTIGDALNQAGATAGGIVSVFVNSNGSGVAPSGTLLANVQTAVTAIKAGGVTATVYAPTIVTVGATANIKVAAGYVSATVLAAALANLQSYLNYIGLGNVSVSSASAAATLAQISEAYVVLRTTPGVANVTNLQLNGGTTDISASYGQQLVAGTITLTPY